MSCGASQPANASPSSPQHARGFQAQTALQIFCKCLWLWNALELPWNSLETLPDIASPLASSLQQRAHGAGKLHAVQRVPLPVVHRQLADLDFLPLYLSILVSALTRRADSGKAELRTL